MHHAILVFQRFLRRWSDPLLGMCQRASLLLEPLQQGLQFVLQPPHLVPPALAVLTTTCELHSMVEPSTSYRMPSMGVW